MNKKVAILLTLSVLGLSLLTYSTQALGGPIPTEWPGSWQMAPEMFKIMARFTAVYNPELDRVYFLGGRLPDNSTSGEIFYFTVSTGVWSLSEEVLDTPVSNYQVVPATDASGQIGYYIIGGRTADGTVTQDVQVYYPDTDTAVTLPADDFPGGAYTPGGVVVVNNTIYAFGGFDGADMYTGTYVFDPLAPAGARWTDRECPLPTGRSYIAAVAAGTMIYAVGGDIFDGTNLIPITDTVALQTAIGVECWRDDKMADLPEAVGDAPAVYIGENALQGSILVMGGNWPVPVNRVLRYRIADDRWEIFPQMIYPRRNQAAVYIPSTSPSAGLGTPGVPGIWTFGGYIDSVTMTSTNEFFENPATLPYFLPFMSR